MFNVYVNKYVNWWNNLVYLCKLNGQNSRYKVVYDHNWSFQLLANTK